MLHLRSKIQSEAEHTSKEASLYLEVDICPVVSQQ